MQISINVEHNVGTVAWVTEQLQNLQLKITTRKGVPSISYLKTWDLKSDKKEEWNTMMVIQSETEIDHDYAMCCRLYGETYVNYTNGGGYEKWAMFKYLTKAAQRVCLTYIEAVADEFEKYLENDEQVGDINFELTVFSNK